MLFAELSVPARPALLASAASVVISGLWLAAVTTGSMAIPCMLPIPAPGIIPQSVPIVAADSVMDADGDAAAWWVAAGPAAVVLPHAAAVTASPTAIAPSAAARPGRLRAVSLNCIASPCRNWIDLLHAPPAKCLPVVVTLG